MEMIGNFSFILVRYDEPYNRLHVDFEKGLACYVFVASGFSSTTISTILEKEKSII